MSRTKMPKEHVKGWIPTMNAHGFMATKLDPYSKAWVARAAEATAPVADVGAAYGVATLKALAKGARVTAVDMEAKHLDILRQRVKDEEQSSRLTTVVGALPDKLTLPQETFEAILVSRVLHFLEPNEVQEAVKQLASWLKRGGRLYLVVETPYIRMLQPFIRTYEARRSAGAKWPGIIADFRRYLNPAERCHAPPRLNVMDPEVLHRICYEAGLDIEECGFIDRQDYDPSIRLDGREGAGIIAYKR